MILHISMTFYSKEALKYSLPPSLPPIFSFLLLLAPTSYLALWSLTVVCWAQMNWNVNHCTAWHQVPVVVPEAPDCCSYLGNCSLGQEVCKSGLVSRDNGSAPKQASKDQISRSVQHLICLTGTPKTHFWRSIMSEVVIISENLST